MIIKQFKEFYKINILWLLLITGLLRVMLFFAARKMETINLMSNYPKPIMPAWMHVSLSNTSNVLLTTILILVQAVFFNQIVNTFIFQKQSYVPALVYVTLTALLPSFLFLSPPLICNLLILIIFYKFQAKQESHKDTIATMYDIGLMCAICTVLYFPCMLLLPMACLGILIFKIFHWRDWVAACLGYATVFLLMLVYYYCTDQVEGMGQFVRSLKEPATPDLAIVRKEIFIILIPSLLVIGYAFLHFFQSFYKKNDSRTTIFAFRGLSGSFRGNCRFCPQSAFQYPCLNRHHPDSNFCKFVVVIASQCIAL